MKRALIKSILFFGIVSVCSAFASPDITGYLKLTNKTSCIIEGSSIFSGPPYTSVVYDPSAAYTVYSYVYNPGEGYPYNYENAVMLEPDQQGEVPAYGNDPQTQPPGMYDFLMLSTVSPFPHNNTAHLYGLLSLEAYQDGYIVQYSAPDFDYNNKLQLITHDDLPKECQ